MKRARFSEEQIIGILKEAGTLDLGVVVGLARRAYSVTRCEIAGLFRNARPILCRFVHSVPGEPQKSRKSQPRG